jgi:AAA ATPase domain
MSDPDDVVDAFARRSPDAAELAIYVSPSVRAEPELLRAMRLRLLPAAGAQAEADLWFSPLVRARGPDGIMFHDDVLRVLRDRLRLRWRHEQQKNRAERAWETIEELHANASPALVLEERVAWLVIRGEGHERMDGELYQALRAIEGGDRPNLVRWAASAWRRLPPEAQQTSAGWLLGQVSGAARRATVRVAVVPEGVAGVDLAALVGSTSRTALGVRRDGGVLELGAVSGPDAAAIEVLDTEPRLVEVLRAGSGREEAEPVPVPAGTVVRVSVGDGAVRLVTALEEVYELPPAWVPEPPDIFALMAAAPAPLSAAMIDSRSLADNATHFFTGRQDTLAQIDAALADPAFRSGYIVITGEPGSGKTTLLAHLASSRGYVHHFSTPNARSPQAFLGNVCAQLIVRYGLDHAELPSGATRDGNVLSDLLAEAANTTASPVVVLVDALDEAGPPPRDGVNTLFLPPALPDGVFLIVTTRLGHSRSLVVDRRRELDLGLDREAIRLYLMARMGAEPDAAVRFGMDVSSLATLLAERSEGNFLYAVSAANELLTGSSGAATLDDLLPRSLSDYYDSHWRAVQERDPGRFRRDHEPVLRILATADAPVSFRDLEQRTGLPRPAIQVVIAEWGQFLDVGGSGEGEETYRLFHSSFRDFVVGALGLEPPGARTPEQQLAAANAISAPAARARTLLGSVPNLPTAMRDEVVELAFTSALAVDDQHERAALLVDLAPYLPATQARDAFAAATALSDPALRAGTLAGLAPFLGREARDDALLGALEACELITDGSERGQALLAVVNVLSGSADDALLELATDMARAVDNAHKRGELLLAIAMRLSETRRIDLLTDAISIGSAETVAAASRALDEIAPGQSLAADPVETIWLPGGRPFVDRASLRSAVRELLDPDGRRVLVVNGPPGSGKSYTVRFIRHIADRTGTFETLHIDLAYSPSLRPTQVATEITVAMGLLPIEVDVTSQPDTQVRLLTSSLKSRVWNAGNWWWVFDNCSSPGLPADTRNLIYALANAAEQDLDNLRLILLGFEQTLGPGLDPLALREQLTQIGEPDIRQWFGDAYRLAGGDPTPKQIDEAVDVLYRSVSRDATIAELSPLLLRLGKALALQPAK